ncbi:hypothetical protein BCV69DRAFT_280181 [Microstroma glucosiphilum]|uniref:Uncharacterized protein n=1 Tax=Pseudomicrostroma glucosiphilum TaxID=1684307 RepID=A0A316UG36_9BASI|nr:hypothetical protein BCV69DRAFT_280181 [Pseudomicrostroma glucosiphilum]PWN24287.1 hypothetical protein BCV69DRAFT_280181 [Pseudomicrostroma glucosiphilum]
MDRARKGGRRSDLIGSDRMSFSVTCPSSWQSWIGYFRDQGFDCIDANLDFEPKTGGGGGAGTGSSSSSSEGDGGAVTGKVQGEEHKILADELTSQIRLSSLQRSPLLFIHAAPSTSLLGLGSSSSSPSPISILHAHLTTRPFISGLIIVENSTGEALSQAQKVGEAAGSGSGSASGSGEKILEEMKSKLGGRLLVVKDSEEGIKEGERWMVEKGF